jgi:Mannosyltransferase putative
LPTAIATRLLSVLDPRQQSDGWWRQENAQRAFRHSADEFIRRIPSYPGGFSGRGIVIAGGGKYFVSTYVTVRVLRHVGCCLPIQIWHLRGEVDDVMRSLLSPYNVSWVDAEEHSDAATFRFHETWWKGWQLKPFAIAHCSFREVLYLDADCYPVRDPSNIFEWQGYLDRGAIFFPDIDASKGLLPANAPAVFGVSDFSEHPCESGQMVINKELCWRELQLALHYNRLADFSYRYLWGDKDTFPLAWHRLGRKFARLWPTSSLNPQAILHFDQHHQVLFQHRAPDKFRLPGTRFDSNHQQSDRPQFNPNLALEQFCHDVCSELQERTRVAEAVGSGNQPATRLGPGMDTGLARPEQCVLNFASMFTPVPVSKILSDEWQDRFLQYFMESGEFDQDPFEFDPEITRPQSNCVSVCLFRKNSNNRHRDEFPVEESGWTQKYWNGLQGRIDEMSRLPDWKLRIYVEPDLWPRVYDQFRGRDCVELYRMRTNSVGASPGSLWRYLAFNDTSLDLVFATDIDESLLGKWDLVTTFAACDWSDLGRLGGFADPRDSLVSPGSSTARNYATILGSRVAARPRRMDFDLAAAMRGFMALRRFYAMTPRAWACSDEDSMSDYNRPFGNHAYGWGAHWYMYCFDERFLAHVLYHHFVGKSTLHTWANSIQRSSFTEAGRLDAEYAAERGNTIATQEQITQWSSTGLKSNDLRSACLTMWSQIP